MIKKIDIIKELKNVMDPHIGIDVYTLGFIYNIDIDKKSIKGGSVSVGNNVKILMTLTTPACPMVSFLVKEVHDVVKSLKGVGDVDVELTFDPPWQAPKKIKEMFKM